MLVSVLPQAYFVQRVAGPRVRVEVMIPPGASPATHEPTLEQLRALSEASLYVKVGHPHFPFERAWLGRVLAQANGLRVVDGSAGLEGGDGDPHVWLAPRHALVMAGHVEAALAALLPEHAAEFRANLAAFAAEVRALDAELRELLAPARGRRFLVFHPAWGHFAEAYGLEQIAIERDGKHPDARALQRLIEGARADGVRVLFVQPQLDPRSAELVAGEVGCRVESLDPLARDWAANLRHVGRALAEALR